MDTLISLVQIRQVVRLGSRILSVTDRLPPGIIYKQLSNYLVTYSLYPHVTRKLSVIVMKLSSLTPLFRKNLSTLIYPFLTFRR